VNVLQTYIHCNNCKINIQR